MDLAIPLYAKDKQLPVVIVQDGWLGFGLLYLFI